MRTITLEVPDELATQLDSWCEQLPQILAFRISAAAQEILSDLLYRNREEELTEAESAELNMYELVHHAIILLKARAHLTDSESNHPSPVK